MFGIGILFVRKDGAPIDEEEAEDLDMQLNNLRAPGGVVVAPDGAQEPRPGVEMGGPDPDDRGFILGVGEGEENESDKLWAQAYAAAWMAKDPNTYELSVGFFEF